MNEPKLFKSSGHTGGIRSTRTGMGFSLVRDISNALPAILGNAVVMTQQRLSKSDTDLEILDTLTQFLIRIYADARKDISGWMGGFEELYEYIEDPRASSIYGILCTNMVLNIYSLLFTSVNNALESEDSLEREDDARMFITACLATLSGRNRKRLLSKIKEHPFPAIPIDISYEPRKYLEEIRKYQEEVRRGSVQSKEVSP